MLGGQFASMAANLRETGLPPRSRLVLLSIAACVDREGWGPPVPMRLSSLADRCGMSSHSLRRSLADLTAAGLLAASEATKWGYQFQIEPAAWESAGGMRQIGASDAPKVTRRRAKSVNRSYIYTPVRNHIDEQKRIPTEVMRRILVAVGARDEADSEARRAG